MKKRIVKILACLVIALMVTTILFGCGGDKEAGKESETHEAPAAVQEKPAEEAAKEEAPAAEAPAAEAPAAEAPAAPAGH